MNFLNRSLVEIDFLSRQIMTFATGSLGAAGTLATITPPDNQTFVLLGALVAPNSMVTVAGGLNYTVELRNEANVRSILATACITFGGASSGANMVYCPSLVKGDILEGDGIKTYTLEATIVTNCNIVGSIYGYLRNT